MYKNKFGDILMKKKFDLKKFYINIIIIGLLLYAIFVLVSQQSKLNNYSETQRYYSELIEDAKKEQTSLNKRKENVNSEEYIEQIARDRLDMFLPNERVYIDIGQ